MSLCTGKSERGLGATMSAQKLALWAPCLLCSFW